MPSITGSPVIEELKDYATELGLGRPIRWVTSQSAGSTYMTSPDGRHWIARKLGGFSLTNGPSVPLAVAANGRIWLAVDGEGGVRRSENGKDWTAVGVPGFDLVGVTWNGRYWLAFGSGADEVIATSADDGATWTARTSPFDGTQCRFVAFNGTQTLAAGGAGGIDGGASDLATSADFGATWTARANPFSAAGRISAGVSNGSRWVVTGTENPGYDHLVITSADGVSWATSDSPHDGDNYILTYVTWDGTYFIGSDPNLDTIRSADGLTWELDDRFATNAYRVGVVGTDGTLLIGSVGGANGVQFVVIEDGEIESAETPIDLINIASPVHIVPLRTSVGFPRTA